MAAAVQEQGRNQSGRYQRRFWAKDRDGEQIAVDRPPAGRAGDTPDLISTAYRNADGLRTVYGLVFDLDAHRASASFKDPEGRLDWQRISETLARELPEVSSRVTHVVRSTHGQGLALVVGMTPLPLRESTKPNQVAAETLQARLIGRFMALGFGADPGARGLVRDYPNFQNPSRVLLHDRQLLRRFEREGERTLQILHRELNAQAAKERQERRIYPDARVEGGLARLLGWLLGVADPGLGLRLPSYLSGETVWATTNELVALTGASARFLRQFLSAPPPWLKATYVRGEGWRLSAVFGGGLQRLLPRMEQLLAPVPPSGAGRGRVPQGFSFTAATLPRPEEVQDGERNRWLTGLALSYKWAGYSQEEALKMIRQRLSFMPDHGSSRNARQVRSIVRSIYKNAAELFGAQAGRPLPEWMVRDEEFAEKVSLLSQRRGSAPVGQGVFGLGRGGESLSGPKLAPRSTSLAVFPGMASEAAAPAERGETVLRALAGSALAPDGAPAPCEFLGERSSQDWVPQLSGGADERPRLALAAIRRGQRVGIFDGDRLILCLTRRHYRAKKVLGVLQRRPEYAGVMLTMFTPHRERQKLYFAAIEVAEVVQADLVCGQKPTYAEKIREWEARHGIEHFFAAGADGGVDPPF